MTACMCVRTTAAVHVYTIAWRPSLVETDLVPQRPQYSPSVSTMSTDNAQSGGGRTTYSVHVDGYFGWCLLPRHGCVIARYNVRNTLKLGASAFLNARTHRVGSCATLYVRRALRIISVKAGKRILLLATFAFFIVTADGGPNGKTRRGLH